MCEANGVNQHSIAAHAGWTDRLGAMDLAYLTNIKQDVVRSLAGFEPYETNYYIARDVDPPESLLAKIFPYADTEYVRFAATHQVASEDLKHR